MFVYLSVFTDITLELIYFTSFIPPLSSPFTTRAALFLACILPATLGVFPQNLLNPSSPRPLRLVSQAGIKPKSLSHVISPGSHLILHRLHPHALRHPSLRLFLLVFIAQKDVYLAKWSRSLTLVPFNRLPRPAEREQRHGFYTSWIWLAIR